MARKWRAKELLQKASRFVDPGKSLDAVLTPLLIAQGASAAMQVRSMMTIETLADVEFRIFSQWGEDGIIEWLVQRNGDMPRSFIEFGVENYRESNTRYLLCHRNWRGLVIDGSAKNINYITHDDVYWRQNLTASCAFITRENINQLFETAGFSGEIGILSVDIDGNDYWVWQAIDSVSPQIVIVEYNAVFGDRLPLVIPYEASFNRTAAHFSNLYFGASVVAFDRLAAEKGYTRLGTNSAGSNAFYIRNDRLSLFSGRVSDTAARPSAFRESRGPDGQLTYLGGSKRLHAIGKCVVTDISTGAVGPLDSFGELYSPAWRAAMDGSP